MEALKTIFVGPNEAGKTAILQALHKLNPADANIAKFVPLRDYPRAKYDADIEHKGIDPSKFTVVEGHFTLTDNEKESFPEEYKQVVYVFGRNLDNEDWCRLENCPNRLT